MEIEPPNPDDYSDNNSQLDDSDTEDDSCPTITIPSEYEQFVYMGRYYANSERGRHWAPDDETHRKALDLMHQGYELLLDGKLYLAPIPEKPQRILDIGTGSGIWAIEFGQTFPSASVLGIDISPEQPEWVPPNVVFQLDDVELEWTFEDESFDFVHIRGLYGSVEDWPKLYKEAYRVLKPGGWVQHIEPGLEISSEHPNIHIDDHYIFAQWADVFRQVGEKTNRPFDLNKKQLDGFASSANFTAVISQVHETPIGGWPKDQKKKQLGHWIHAAFLEALDGHVKRPLCETLSWSEEEMHVFSYRIRRALNNPNNRPTTNYFSLYAQKPEAPSSQTPAR